MRILVTGAKGQLGSAAANEAARRGHDALGVDMEDFDITDEAKTRAYLAKAGPDCVIHCAAYTAVDRAESEPERARAVNALGTENIAAHCAAENIWLLYISTDYVFDGGGSSPWEIDGEPNPLNVYGATKLAGERAARECAKHMIVRTSWVFGPGGQHFVNTMLRLGRENRTVRVVDDQVGSPTYTLDLARLLLDMAERPRAGTYHATNQGYTSWAAFAKQIFALAGIPCEVAEISSGAFRQKAKRPLNSRLSPKSLTEAGYALPPPWQDALARYLREQEPE